MPEKLSDEYFVVEGRVKVYEIMSAVGRSATVDTVAFLPLMVAENDALYS